MISFACVLPKTRAFIFWTYMREHAAAGEPRVAGVAHGC